MCALATHGPHQKAHDDDAQRKDAEPGGVKRLRSSYAVLPVGADLG
jgi:hypothetical protein